MQHIPSDHPNRQIKPGHLLEPFRWAADALTILIEEKPSLIIHPEYQDSFRSLPGAGLIRASPHLDKLNDPDLRLGIALDVALGGPEVGVFGEHLHFWSDPSTVSATKISSFFGLIRRGTLR